jgi:hypothetical protein
VTAIFIDARPTEFMRASLSAMKALALLSTLESADSVLPTTDGCEIRLRRITEPTAEQKALLQQLGFSLPQPPRVVRTKSQM